MTSAKLRALLARTGMRQREAAEVCAVSIRQLQNWLSGRTPIPVLAAQALMAEEGARADAAFERQPQQVSDDVLGGIEMEQERIISHLEKELIEARKALDRTRRMRQP